MTAETPPVKRSAAEKPEKIRCDACPVMCYIAEGRAGACDRYANEGGELVRLDPLTILRDFVNHTFLRSDSRTGRLGETQSRCV